MNEDLFLPEPVPREVKYTIISVDDHVVEPPHTFEGRLPTRLQERAPKVVETPEGHQVWEFEGQTFTQVGMNAVAGRRRETVNTVNYEPFRFEQMRPGCYDVDARVHDMDINGVWASVNFPSMITGFCGTRVLRRAGPGARRRVHAGMERLALRGVVPGPPDSDRPARRRRSSPTRRRPPPRSTAMPSAGSLR